MAIEKGIMGAPVGIEADMETMGMDDQPIEIEIVNPDAVMIDDGSTEVAIIPGGMDEFAVNFEDNLAEFMDEDQLRLIGQELIGHIETDISSRKEWADTFVEGLELLGLKHEERTTPWDGACGVYSSVLSEAAIRFQAETMTETFPATGPVKTKVIGDETKEKLEAAQRVKADMNYQLQEVMDEYRAEHERLLYSLGLSGSAFKKVYFDQHLGRQVASYIAAEEVIVPYGAANLNTAERVTHIMRKTENEIERLKANRFYRDVDLGEPSSFQTDIDEKKAETDGFTVNEDNRHTLFEIHVDTVIEGFDDEDGLAKPYVITVDSSSGEVLSIYRNWNESDPKMLKRQHFVHYTYLQGFGFYGLGLIHIIGGYSRAGTSLIRQLVDAGTLANLPGGLKTRDLRVRGDDTPIAPGEWKDVDVTSGSLRENLMPLPYKEPSQTLLALLNQITEEGRRLGAVSDLNISDMSANAPVGTTLALLERTLKPMTAVQARVHYAMKQEFKLLKTIIAQYTPSVYDYTPASGDRMARREDYSLVEVIPVSDPNSSTMAQRVTQYQAALQMAQGAPQIYDLPELHRQMLEVLGIKNIDKLIPSTKDRKPKDPVSENMDAMLGTPLKAFIYQDHDAHIATHISMLQNPQIMQMVGQNPMAQQIASSLQAHIVEHLSFKYRADVEKQLGVSLPKPGEELPEDMEVQLSRLVATASSQLSQQKQQEAAQQQAMQKAQDPVIQLQQQEQARKDRDQALKERQAGIESEIKMREQARKEAETQNKAITEQQKLDLDREELYLQFQIDNDKLASTEDVERARLRLQEIQNLRNVI